MEIYFQHDYLIANVIARLGLGGNARNKNSLNLSAVAGWAIMCGGRRPKWLNKYIQQPWFANPGWGPMRN